MHRSLRSIAGLSLFGLALVSEHAVAQEKPADTNGELQVKALLFNVAGLPPELKPGECYTQVIEPAKYQMVEDRVLIKPEVIRYEVTPAEFKDVEKEVVVTPETVRYEIIPAQYETKEVEVVVAPEFAKQLATEPEFQVEEHKLETRAARLAIKLGANIFDKSQLMSSEALCLLADPAEFKIYARSLLVKPAKVEQEKVARVIEKVATQVLVKPAEVKEVKVPAETKKFVVKEMVRPASKKEIKIAAEYITVTRQQLVAPEKIVWQRVLCSANVTPVIISKIQQKLKEKGIEPGEVNGQLNDQTKAAIVQYQTQNKIAQGGLTYEFLEHIGVKPGQ